MRENVQDDRGEPRLKIISLLGLNKNADREWIRSLTQVLKPGLILKNHG